MLSASRNKPSQRFMKIRLIQQKRVVPFVRHNFQKTHIRRHMVQRAGDGAGLGGGEQPVGGERDQQKACFRAFEGGGEAAVVVGRQVEWRYCLLAMVTCAIGGYTSARFARMIPEAVLRGLVIVIGFSMAAWFFWSTK